MTITFTPETQRVVNVMTSRYFLIQPDGSIKRLNEHNKAIDWTFRQKAAALRAGQRGNVAVWDKETGRFV